MPKEEIEKFNQPVSGLVTPRFGGIATFMRLPHVALDEVDGIEIGLAGIPWDARNHQPPGRRGMDRARSAINSSMVRRMHQAMPHRSL